MQIVTFAINQFGAAIIFVLMGLNGNIQPIQSANCTIKPLKIPTFYREFMILQKNEFNSKTIFMGNTSNLLTNNQKHLK